MAVPGCAHKLPWDLSAQRTHVEYGSWAASSTTGKKAQRQVEERDHTGVTLSQSRGHSGAEVGMGRAGTPTCRFVLCFLDPCPQPRED